MTYNRNTLELIAQDNVVLINLNDNSKIFTNELIYNNKTKIISNVNSESKMNLIIQFIQVILFMIYKHILQK